MQSLRVSILLASLGAAWALDVSPKVAEYMSLVNGDYDNAEAVKNSSGQINHCVGKFVPIYNPAFQPSTMWYIQGLANDVLWYSIVAFISDGPGDMIYLSTFNYTDVSKSKVGQIDPSELARAKTLNLTGYNCTAVFRRLARGIYIGIYPDCNHVTNKQHPFFAETFDCDDLEIFTPPTLKNIDSPILLTLRRTGKRYPMNGIPDSFDSICPRDN